jgi:hypothetical protein
MLKNKDPFLCKVMINLADKINLPLYIGKKMGED